MRGQREEHWSIHKTVNSKLHAPQSLKGRLWQLRQLVSEDFSKVMIVVSIAYNVGTRKPEIELLLAQR